MVLELKTVFEDEAYRLFDAEEGAWVPSRQQEPFGREAKGHQEISRGAVANLTLNFRVERDLDGLRYYMSAFSTSGSLLSLQTPPALWTWTWI